MALIESIQIGNTFKDAPALFEAVEAICSDLKTKPLKIKGSTSSILLVKDALNFCQKAGQKVSFSGYYPYEKTNALSWVTFFLKYQQQFAWTLHFKHKHSELNDPPYFSIYNQSELAIELTTEERGHVKSFVARIEEEYSFDKGLFYLLEQCKTFTSSDKKLRLYTAAKHWSLRFIAPVDDLQKHIPLLIKYVKPKQMSFHADGANKSYELLANFIQAQNSKGKHTIKTSLEYDFVKNLCYSHSNEPIEVQLPEGLTIWLKSKELILFGFWDDISKRKQAYEKELKSYFP